LESAIAPKSSPINLLILFSLITSRRINPGQIMARSFQDSSLT
jgi:hypothetical protein